MERSEAWKERELLALGACLASPNLLKTVDSRAFQDARIIQIIDALKLEAEQRTGKHPESLLSYFRELGITVSGKATEALLERVWLATERRRVELWHEKMNRTAKVMDDQTFLNQHQQGPPQRSLSSQPKTTKPPSSEPS